MVQFIEEVCTYTTSEMGTPSLDRTFLINSKGKLLSIYPYSRKFLLAQNFVELLPSPLEQNFVVLIFVPESGLTMPTDSP